MHYLLIVVVLLNSSGKLVSSRSYYKEGLADRYHVQASMKCHVGNYKVQSLRDFIVTSDMQKKEKND